MKGRIIRPDFYSGDKIVQLTATVKSGSVTKKRVFDFLVRKAPRTPDQALQEDENYLKKNIPSKIKDDVVIMKSHTLPAGCSVKWDIGESKNITVDGKVTRPDFGLTNVEVSLKAKLTKGETTREITLPVTILSLTEEDEISAAAKLVNWDLIKNKNIDKARVTSDLTLPATLGGITVTWASSNPNYISAKGVVTRPEYVDSDVQVSLTAYLNKGAKKSSVTITGVKVLRKSASAKQRCEEYVTDTNKWMHWLTANGTNTNKDLNSIKESFILPAENEDIMLTWSVVNSSGEPAEVSYFKIQYQDNPSAVSSGPLGLISNKRYVATIVRPADNTVQVYMKVKAQISATEVDSVQVPGGDSEKIHTLVILGEKVKEAPASVPTLKSPSEGVATWSAPAHKSESSK